MYMYCMMLCVLYRLWDQSNQQLAWTMNMVTIHSSFVDCFEEMLIASSDFSFMWSVCAQHTM